MKSQDLKKINLPDAPGVYFFFARRKGGKHGSQILYIGKATSLKDRVKSYFARDILLTRSPLIAKMLEEAGKVEFVETDSVLEALLLEANEIKKYQPLYNSKEKDDKSYNYVTITEEDFPKVVVTRGAGTYGPFPHGVELREALKIIRKLFPYRDKCKPAGLRHDEAGSGLAKAGKPCFNAQIGLCPGPCAGWISKRDYKKVIRHLRLFFEAKKSQLVRSLEKSMNQLSKEYKFEEAGKVKKQIFALDHIQDIALIKENLTTDNQQTTVFRIEAYDIAHISGKDVVGVMTVIEDGELAKSQYRKFKIRADKNDDTKNLKEIISRRLAHPEWRFPNLIVVDGGKGQINAAKKILEESGLEIVDVVSVVKDEKHRAREVLGFKGSTLNPDFQGRALEKAILLANAEAHRFAIGFHRKLRRQGFRL